MGEVEAEKKPQSGSHLFSLEVISSFLGDNHEAMSEVLHTFMTDTSRNMDLLQKALTAPDGTQINAIAHRMLPMFRQLRANDIVPILEQLEVLPESAMDPKQLKVAYGDLKNRITVLLLAIKAYLMQPVTDLNHSD
jgi:HPt (histidine-containing phosphotransfer) domain-containing protein